MGLYSLKVVYSIYIQKSNFKMLILTQIILHPPQNRPDLPSISCRYRYTHIRDKLEENSIYERKYWLLKDEKIIFNL